MAVGLIGYAVFKGRTPKIEYTTVPVIRGELVQTVSEVGTVKANKELDLNFAQTGKVDKILVKVGDQVKKDQLLMELDYGSLLIKQQEAQSSLEIAKANLQKLLSGPTAADLAVSQAQVAQAQVAYQGAVDSLSKARLTLQESLTQAKKRLSDLQDNTPATLTPLEQAVATAKTALDNAGRTGQQSIETAKNSLLSTIDYKLSLANNALDSIDRIINDNNAKDSLSVKNTAYLPKTKSDWSLARDRLAPALSDLSAVKSAYTDAKLKAASASALQALNSTYTALDDCFKVLENSVTSSSFSQTSLDSFKTSISTQQSAVNTGLSALQSAADAFDNANLSYQTSVATAATALSQAQANLDDGLTAAANSLNSLQVSMDQQLGTAQSQADAAKQAWDVAQSQLAKLKSPARREDIDLAKAQVGQAQASLDLATRQIADNAIKAPIDGQITKINYESGEQFSTAKPALSLLTENNFEIDVDISESDIAKVKVGDKTAITFDAFGDGQKLEGAVGAIDPASTVIQDVIYYKVKIFFQPSPQIGVKPGMTANVVITTDRRDQALVVPARAIVEKEGRKFVRILSDKTVIEAPVTVGLAGDDGLSEILSGDIKPGDLAITFIKDPSKK